MTHQFPHRFTLALLVLLAFAACGPARYAKNYVLAFPPIAPTIAAPPVIRGALTLEEFQCPDYLCEGRIVYRPSQEEIGFYEFHRWAMNPREMITQLIGTRIRSEALFKSVALKGTSMEPAYVLRGKIEQLEEVDEGRDVRVVCTISAQLFDTHAKSIIWTHTESQTIPVEERNVAGVVSSLSDAARIAVDNMVKSLGEALPPATLAEGGRR